MYLRISCWQCCVLVWKDNGHLSCIPKSAIRKRFTAIFEYTSIDFGDNWFYSYSILKTWNLGKIVSDNRRTELRCPPNLHAESIHRKPVRFFSDVIPVSLQNKNSSATVACVWEKTIKRARVLGAALGTKDLHRNKTQWLLIFVPVIRRTCGINKLCRCTNLMVCIFRWITSNPIALDRSACPPTTSFTKVLWQRPPDGSTGYHTNDPHIRTTPETVFS